MTKKNQDIQSRILSQLFHADGKHVSGVRLSEQMGVSRVAVWKHIKTLQAAGVAIASGPAGYRLSFPDDLLAGPGFPEGIRERVCYFHNIPSTMDRAREMARKGAPHLSVVIAEIQSAGRGRLNRQWFSSSGGLWFTLILRPDVPPQLAYIYNFAASLSLSITLNKACRAGVSVKWPNDLLIGKKKLAGLLSEMETRGDMVEFINIGIGINVNNTPGIDEPRAVSLKDILGSSLPRRTLLVSFLQDFSERIAAPDTKAIMDQWKQQTSTLGSQVRIETPGEIYEGIARDVDESGALLIETVEGETRKIIYGDCFHT